MIHAAGPIIHTRLAKRTTARDRADARLVVAVVAIVDEVKHRAVQHLIVHDDGDDAQGARGDGGDERDDRESGDGDGEGDGGDEGGETVADVDPKAPRRVLRRGIERGVLGEDNGPILERQRLGEEMSSNKHNGDGNTCARATSISFGSVSRRASLASRARLSLSLSRLVRASRTLSPNFLMYPSCKR